MTAPGREGDNVVTLTKRGGGALYWSAAAKYFDTRTPIERTGGRRLAIAREYFALTSRTAQNGIVYRETPFSGTAAPGDVVLVRLTVAGADDWRYLLIEDPLPAGAETIADDSLYPLEKPRSRSWGGRQEFRDDRAVFFQDGLPGGRVEFWYLLKIVTPGTFRAMPAQVTPMYVPGVSASTTPHRRHRRRRPRREAHDDPAAGDRRRLAARRATPSGWAFSGACCRYRKARCGC